MCFCSVFVRASANGASLLSLPSDPLSFRPLLLRSEFAFYSLAQGFIGAWLSGSWLWTVAEKSLDLRIVKAETMRCPGRSSTNPWAQYRFLDEPILKHALETGSFGDMFLHGGEMVKARSSFVGPPNSSLINLGQDTPRTPGLSLKPDQKPHSKAATVRHPFRAAWDATGRHHIDHH